ncbi:ankyrin repeat-containing domain protein [Penicillium herquei]|nr:ankyrin repeat-containing domain protein [Penicillium herquei]
MQEDEEEDEEMPGNYETLVEELIVDNGSYCKSSLQWAASNGIASLVQMITNNIDNATLIEDAIPGPSSLGLAARLGHTQVVRILLDKGYPVDQTTSIDTLTPLAYAARYRHIGVADLLIERGADIEAKMQDGQTPLYLTAHTGNAIIAKKLLDNGAEIRIRTTEGKNLLHIAAKNHNEEVLSFLLDWCAEHECQDLIKDCDNSGTTLLHEVCKGCCNISFIERLFGAGPLPGVFDHNWESPLMWALRGGFGLLDAPSGEEDEFLRKVELLSRDPIVMLTPAIPQKMTPLHHAAGLADYRVFEWLLENGGRRVMNQKNASGDTPLLIALDINNENVVRILLSSQGIDITLRRNTQETALHLAAQSCTLKEMSSILERHPVLLNAIDQDERTPLLAAFSASRLDNCEYLLKQGADACIADITGQDPLRWASEETEEIEFLQLLLDRDLVSLDRQGNTLLHKAVRGVSVDRVSSLLNSPDINLHDRNALGETALHVAVQNGCRAVTDEIVQILLENDRDGTLAAIHSNSGKTALDFALERGISIGILVQPMWKSTVGIEWDSESFWIMRWSQQPWYSDLVPIIDAARPMLAAQTQQLVNECGGLPFTVSRNTPQQFVWRQDAESLSYLSLQIPPGAPSPVQRLIFTMISNDQGWSDRHPVNERNEGSYCGSRTWFEVGISRPDHVNLVTSHREIQRNIHTSDQKRVHTVIWDISDETPGLREWLSKIQGGDLLHIYPKAYQVGWRNCVLEVAVTVFHHR